VTFLEKLVITEKMEKILVFHGTGNFIVVFKTAHHWTLL
jgi:hypothetical protein